MDVVANDCEILPAQKVAEPLFQEAVELKSLDADVACAAREQPPFPYRIVAAREFRAPLVFRLKGDPCRGCAASFKGDRAAVYAVPHDNRERGGTSAAWVSFQA